MINRPTRGQQFIHMRAIRPGAVPPYTEDDYDIMIVTATRIHRTEVSVYYVSKRLWDQGHHKAMYAFRLSEASSTVRKWI